MGIKGAPVRLTGNGRGLQASTMAPSTRSFSRAISTARANPIVEVHAVAAMSSLQAASMPIMMASEAVLRSRCRLSTHAIPLATIGVGVRVMITRIVRLALCISIFRRGQWGQTGSQLSGRMGKHGMVSRALTLNPPQKFLTRRFRWWPDGLLQADGVSTDVDVWVPVDLRCLTCRKAILYIHLQILLGESDLHTQ